MYEAQYTLTGIQLSGQTNKIETILINICQKIKSKNETLKHKPFDEQNCYVQWLRI